MESAPQRPWVHRKKWVKENHRKVSYPSTFIGKTKETKHPVKLHCIGFLCFSYTKPNTPSNKIPLFFIPLFLTCIPIIFLYFSCSYVFLILRSKGSLGLLPLLLLLTVHMSFYLYKGSSNNKIQPSLTNDCSCTAQERDPVAWWHFTFARFCLFFSDP